MLKYLTCTSHSFTLVFGVYVGNVTNKYTTNISILTQFGYIISKGEIIKPRRIFLHASTTHIALCKAFNNNIRVKYMQ